MATVDEKIDMYMEAYIYCGLSQEEWRSWLT